MTHIDVDAAERALNPVDAVEHLAEMNDWVFDRSGEDEITISVSGGHCDYNVSFTWMEEIEGLHLACAFDFKVAALRRTEILDLLARVNEQLWIGHFDLWAKEGVVLFRQTLVLSGGAEVSGAQVELLLKTAVETAERYYPAFQFVTWAGKSAPEALDSVLLETAGSA
jgi:hypothetical protein